MENNNQTVFEHLWKYFEIHAQQRMTVFNYFIVVAGATITGIGFCIQQGVRYNYFASCLGFFLLILSFMFWKLDQRVSMFVKAAEEALIEHEKKFEINSFKIFTNEKIKTASLEGITSAWTFGKCFRYTFAIMGYIGFISIFLPHLMN
ncbi:hypothetical protein RZP54_21825 [Raoultella ornithinolytica]|uniref:hypothetical protein n=1 Tax=Raoultella ornithinolytica TaxID=54291 RepID=UPI001A26768D|nr:hypothetical protein [Raoultella ornithinolytica]MDV0591597.1 hypothetical protein [Raoultella ornithinolytica]HAT1561812.1 hypothetical protein [Raoultella ornithinolytica]HDT6530072.1 hypothetical protein [Raoultella ornithinolytica]